jgi:hypothetical protein
MTSSNGRRAFDGAAFGDALAWPRAEAAGPFSTPTFAHPANKATSSGDASNEKRQRDRSGYFMVDRRQTTRGSTHRSCRAVRADQGAIKRRPVTRFCSL